jgi:hypothetical protein
MDTLKDKMTAFAKELPTSGVAYNKNFYFESLPSMITLIKTADIADVDEEQTDDQDEEQSVTPEQPSQQNLVTAQI